MQQNTHSREFGVLARDSVRPLDQFEQARAHLKETERERRARTGVVGVSGC